MQDTKELHKALQTLLSAQNSKISQSSGTLLDYMTVV